MISSEEGGQGARWPPSPPSAPAAPPGKRRAPGGGLLLALGALAVALSLGTAALRDAALPEPLPASAPPDLFSEERARAVLRNMTAMGPRVAGSEEAARAALQLAATLRAVPHGPHQRLEVELWPADGGFPLAFMDGMVNVYRGVVSVVARLGGKGARPARHALLLNCHYDTVPDSPGAGDDAAGCAVLVETWRALAAEASPLPHDLLLLLNGAEENIMQGSHAFVTGHRWAGAARAFINVEACGAGGRELVFQAGPGRPALLQVYARTAPRPHASSLAQEVFESGLVPGDTDFRVFRDHGALSGLDLAWSGDGYAYHTRLDDEPRLPPGALQRAGDNVLAVTRALLRGRELEEPPDGALPVYFDVLGLVAVAVEPHAALGVAVLVGAALLLAVAYAANDAHKRLGVSRSWWWGRVLDAGGRLALAAAGGTGSALALALVLHAVRARMSWYARPALLGPLYGCAALGGACLATARLWRRSPLAPAWRARAAAGGAALGWAALLGACAASRLRSGYLPALWAASTAPGLAAAHRLPPVPAAVVWTLLALPPQTLTWALGLSSLQMFVPVMGRAGVAVPADVVMALMTSAVALGATLWALPAAAAGGARKAAQALLAVSAAAALFALAAEPYSAERPQRVMLFHTRRTWHSGDHTESRSSFWLPALDANTPSAALPLRGLRPMGADGECERDLYCGAPYYLPVRSLVPHGFWAEAESAPAVQLEAALRWEGEGVLRVEAGGAAHGALVLSPAPGVRLEAVEGVEGAPLEGPRWQGRRTYFVAVFAAEGRWALRLRLRAETPPEGPWLRLSLAGHALFGPLRESAEAAAVRAALGPELALTGWGVDLHLYEL